MSFQAKIMGEKSNQLWLVTGQSGFLSAWWFVYVTPLKISSFKLALNSSSIKLSEYGNVVLSGWGDEPSVDDVEEVRKLGFKLNESFAA